MPARCDGEIQMPTIMANALRRLSLSAFLIASALTGEMAFAADMEETPGADLKAALRASRACTDNCILDCRAERAGCEGEQKPANVCRPQFQICARRCVVACSPR